MTCYDPGITKLALPHALLRGHAVDFEVEKLGRMVDPEYERALFEAYKPEWLGEGYEEAVADKDFPKIRSWITVHLWSDLKALESAKKDGSPLPAGPVQRIGDLLLRKHEVAVTAWVRRNCRFAAGPSKVLYMMRGVSGSGKSTLARRLGEGGAIFSTDDFFTSGGKYEFDRSVIGRAHAWNQARAIKAMGEGEGAD